MILRGFFRRRWLGGLSFSKGGGGGGVDGRYLGKCKERC